MRSVHCPTPLLCAARSHRAGSASERACRARRATRAAAAAVRASAPVVTDGSCKMPLSQLVVSGGRVSVDRSIIVDSWGLRERANVHLRAGVVHREGGPAVVTDSTTMWVQDGALHRADGPARTDKAMWGRVRSSYHLRGREVARQGGELDAAGVFSNERIAHLLAAGAPRSHVAGYLGFDVPASHALVAAKVDPDLVLQAAAAGIRDAAVVLAAHHGSMPLSWALAGT